MKKILIILCLNLFATMFSYGQRQMENLDRGLVAVQVSKGVFVSWRIMGQEWNNTQYNLYRNGVKLNSEPLSVSNYLDEGGNTASSYTISLVKEGIETPEPANCLVMIHPCNRNLSVLSNPPRATRAIPKERSSNCETGRSHIFIPAIT
ncbi:MAG: hypothetical protein PHF48_08910, partial [Bacteroidales bacterium]|nr:hypothetical protein [Bacteroidales bacterium]